MPDTFHDRLREVRRRIAQAARSAGRDEREITLIAVTKTVPLDRIRAALAEGLDQFGESRVPEALPKIAALPGHVHWHLIGHLQKNKVNKVVGAFSLIHSVDSVELAQKIDEAARRAEIVQNILVQVNAGEEAQKHGVLPAQAEALVAQIAPLAHVRVLGLMAMAPQVARPDDALPYFGRVREIFERLRGERLPHASMEILSMGMSGDFEAAIMEGATHVRVGSLLFCGR